ncbi:MAG TPA: tetratricopeptide repeat protein [Pyrinomonadaceae bacterium]
MPQTRRPSVITLRFSPPALRWLLLLPAILALTGAWFAMRWYVGNTIAEYTATPDADGIEMVRMATRWAPGDALPHWRLAFFEEKNFSAENLAASVREYELAVQAEPYDYRYWMELGRALEATGDDTSGEKALRRAVELAPSYSHPRWQYGNLLLRQGRTDDAFAQLSRAAEADELMQAPVFALASQVFGDDTDKIVRALPSTSLRLQIALNLINSGKSDDALRIVRTVSRSDRQSNREVTEQVVKSLIANHQFRAALALLSEIEPDANQLPETGQFWNGGFEMPLTLPDPKPFHWMIESRTQAQFSLDGARAHSGRDSLRIVFKSAGKIESIPITQTVIVEPDTQYKFQFYQRTEALTSASTPFVVVSDTSGHDKLTSSPPLPSGTTDWQPVTLTFKTMPKQDGILISLYRSPCSEKDPVCPIFGTVWYDDFTLQRISGPGSAKPGAPSR